jgi:NTP pyrophosphatase (non-canonical NTP hydrolase)
MNKKINEILLITQEECAEVTQAISKVFRFGMDDSHKGETNRERLEEEVGDLMCMIDLLIESGIVSESAVMTAKDEKMMKLKTWSSIFKEEGEEVVVPRCSTYPACLLKGAEGQLTIINRPEIPYPNDEF